MYALSVGIYTSIKILNGLYIPNAMLVMNRCIRLASLQPYWFLACTKHSYCASGIRSARRKVFSWWNSELLASPGIMMLVQSFPPPAIFSPLPDPSFCRKRKKKRRVRFYWFVKEKNLNFKICLFYLVIIHVICLAFHFCVGKKYLEDIIAMLKFWENFF